MGLGANYWLCGSSIGPTMRPGAAGKILVDIYIYMPNIV